ncbi:galactose mutarotase-like enzyme [Dokdonia sp. Hel_I_63]|uniref:aldose 1-epimerase family protein n=1 Tax=Dokdonia sp. Hel_I_63 TaxID=1249996 RepID=UPI00119C8567|nr:aldose 1-epimerase family protein [Dokdonia sp. Hel_I_63]TVZ23806.1 galactose mutarotase-like enzyme [Dokdonia sp. Hel_I_63]
MLHTIHNENLICTITSKGAEIRSLINKETGEEYIWQIDPSVWGSSSPVLFPAIGNIKENKIVFNGEDYAMTKHGIIRNNEQLDFQQHDASSCSFTLTSSDETLRQYPYTFHFRVSFTLVEYRLLMTYTVTNNDTVPMHFACGGHTAYACPLDEHTALSDYVIEFPEPLDLESRTLGNSGLLSPEKRPIKTDNGQLPLSETIFNEDALIFTDINYDWVRLRKRDEKKGIIVRFKDYPNLALWSKPGADYVCIEPWLGLPDSEDESIDITKKGSYKTLSPGATFDITIETEIEQN